MIFLIRLIQNAVSIYSIILVAFALLSWFPNAYESQLGRLVIRLVIKAMEKAQNLRKKEEVVEEAPAAPTELEVLQEIKALLEKK